MNKFKYNPLTAEFEYDHGVEVSYEPVTSDISIPKTRPTRLYSIGVSKNTEVSARIYASCGVSVVQGFMVQLYFRNSLGNIVATASAAIPAVSAGGVTINLTHFFESDDTCDIIIEGAADFNVVSALAGITGSLPFASVTTIKHYY